MDKKYWLIATAIVIGALALLAYPPTVERERVVGNTAAPDIVDLPAVDAPPIATVELEARNATDSATELTTRFEGERRDAAWADWAVAEIERSLAAIADATIARSECRSTVCRIELQATTPAERPALVAAATAALQRDGHETLLERADGMTATFVIGVRKPQTP